MDLNQVACLFNLNAVDGLALNKREQSEKEEKGEDNFFHEYSIILVYFVI